MNAQNLSGAEGEKKKLWRQEFLIAEHFTVENQVHRCKIYFLCFALSAEDKQKNSNNPNLHHAPSKHISSHRNPLFALHSSRLLLFLSMKIIDKIHESQAAKKPFFSFEYFPPKTVSHGGRGRYGGGRSARLCTRLRESFYFSSCCRSPCRTKSLFSLTWLLLLQMREMNHPNFFWKKEFALPLCKHQEKKICRLLG